MAVRLPRKQPAFRSGWHTPVHRSPRPYSYLYVQGLYQNPGYYDALGKGVNRGHADAPGGQPYEGYPWGHVETEFAGGPDSIADELVFKARGPTYRVPQYIPPADPIRWTDSGPLRPEMSFRTFTWRRWANTSTTSSRFWGVGPDGKLDAGAGMHTSIPDPSTPDRNRGANKPYWEKQPRDNRLSTARYRGQSYSQLTRPVEFQRLGG